MKVKRPLAVLVILMVVAVVLQQLSLAAGIQSTFSSPIPTPSPTSSPFPLPTPSPTPPPSDEAQIALRYVSETHDIPLDKLQVGDEIISQYPLTGRTLWRAKVGDAQGTKVYLVEIDLENRQVVDGEAIRRAEGEAYRQTYGKLEPDLYDRLQTLDDGETIKVSIWLLPVDVEQIRAQVVARYPEARLEGFRPGRETDLELYEKIYAEMKEAEKQAYQEREASVIAFLESQGLKVTYASQLAPLVFAELPRNAILELAKRDDVQEVFLTRRGDRLLDSAVPTDRVAPVWNRGITGAGVQVAVVEDDGVDFGHNDLADGSYFDPAHPNIADHATMVAGVIASTDETYRGVAYGVPALYSANSGSYNVDDLIAATEGAISAGSRVLNHSYWSSKTGNIDDLARYHDHVVFYDWRTMVVAAGNGTLEFVNAPALAYNVIAVGGTDDKNTSSWSDDTMWDEGNLGSSYLNPNDGREKPEVVAVARDLTSTTLNNGIDTQSGTSFAAPQVAGLAALLMQRQNALKYWPEAVKAIIMASAVHNVDGPSGIPTSPDLKDGAGAIDAAAADVIATTGHSDIWQYPFWRG